MEKTETGLVTCYDSSLNELVSNVALDYLSERKIICIKVVDEDGKEFILKLKKNQDSETKPKYYSPRKNQLGKD